MPRRINAVEPEAVLSAIERIVLKGGIRSLNVRTLAKEAGVSVGSTYNIVPGGLDGIVEAVNTRTLIRLAEHMETIENPSLTREYAALHLAEKYVCFVKNNAALMEMMLGYSFPEDYEESAAYAAARLRSIDAVTPVVGLFFENAAECREAVMTLWASLQGIASLSASGKLNETYPAEKLACSLVSRFLGFRIT